MEDRISSLPDDVMIRILSLLPTEDAVTISFLSKRLYSHPLWRLVPIVNLNYERDSHNKAHDEAAHYSLFCDFVFSVLMLRDVTQPIKRFTLKCVYDDNVKTWLCLVLQRDVEYIKLNVCSDYVYRPISILNCRTLVVLKLSGFHLNHVSSVQLPSLKILHLTAVNFAHDHCLVEFLHGCPNIEDFKALRVFLSYHCDSSQKFKSLTKLSRVEISFGSSIKFLLEAILNIEYDRKKILPSIGTEIRDGQSPDKRKNNK